MKTYENPTMEIVEIAIDEIMNASVGNVSFEDLIGNNDFNWKINL